MKRGSAGSKKVRKEVRQYCIDGVYFHEVLDSVPGKVKILQLSIRLGSPFGRTKLNVSNEMRKLGVLYRTVPKEGCKEIVLRFTGMSRAAMKRNLKAICLKEGMDYKKAKVRRMIVTHEGVTAHFKEIKKEIRPDNTDQRKKLNVLGLDITEKLKDAHIAKLIRAMSLARYSCNMEKIEIYRIQCSKVR